MPMIKSVKKISFIREFAIEEKAKEFASKNQGKIQVFYNWDDMKNRIVKIYRVKY